MPLSGLRAWIAARAGESTTCMGLVIMLAAAWLYHRGFVLHDLYDLGTAEAIGALCVIFRETPAQAIAQINSTLDQMRSVITALPSRQSPAQN